jgi:dolichol-phosphate mannosyltransferase
MRYNYAVIIPLANEERDFLTFTNELKNVLNRIEEGTVYFIIDRVSRDKTLDLSLELSKNDNRFKTIWSPENKNVVDAYLKGYKEAVVNNHDFIIEMDAGMSHDPNALPMFLRVLNEGNECAFGSRFINGGSICDSNWKRTFLSKTGTCLSNFLLGSKMKDMTSGYQGFHLKVVKKFLDYNLRSKAHFYQTELRYLLRNTRFAEIPIHYRAPSPSVSKKAITNSLIVLFYYFLNRVKGRSKIINL